MATKYYRGPDEPGGSGDIMLEVVDGKTGRAIERFGLSVECRDNDYPVDIDMEELSDYVWEIDRDEFEAAWERCCGSQGSRE
jgi:hypothetical protein